MKTSEIHLDSILCEVGEFGKYQLQILLLFMIINGLVFFSNVIFVFEGKPVDHRCVIPDCENGTLTYLTPWIINAIPFKDGKPKRCERYSRLNTSSCTREDFNGNVTEKCESFVYETPEITIMHDFNLHCDENIKKLTFVGTLNGIGKFIGLPIAGVISDKYGRKRILIISMVLTGLCGILRSFATSYEIFLIFKFLDSFFISGAFASVYVIAAELVGPRKRVLVNTAMTAAYALASVTLGSVGWFLQSWRVFLRIIYSCFTLTIICKWLIPESLRWLSLQKKHDEVKTILEKIAKVNEKSISYSSLRKLTENVNNNSVTVYPIKELFKSRILLTRCVACSYSWICCIFVYYGLSLTSVTLSGNTYLDFIFTCLIEIPACLVTFFVVDRIGRRVTLLSGYMLTCIFSVVLIFVPKDTYWINLTAYLVAKFGVSITMNVNYMITNEMFPTSIRQTLLSICSMFGRIGNIMVTQLFLLREIWIPFPFVLFAVLTGIATLTGLSFPETRNIILPDTIQEAENIGKKKILYLEDMD